jgi:hypothetical protein
MAMSHDIFVSYSSEDKAVADAVVSALENSGLRCWVAPRDIKPSADWGDAITEAISACKMVLLIFSGNSNRSKHVRDEIYYAISEEKTILPFRIENLDPTGSMRLHLSSRHWLDAFQPSWQTHINRLVGSAADSLGHELVPPAAQLEASAQVVAPTPAPAAAPKKSGRKIPWLWIGLAAGAAAVLGLAGILWFGRGGGEEGLPTDVPAVQSAGSTASAPSVPTPTPGSRTLIVTSAEDSGPGTVRQAIRDAEAGDTITFDPEVFPPENPASVALSSGLPAINQGNLTIDASDAGVILDGSRAGGVWTPGIELASNNNSIYGLQVVHFTGPGILINPDARFNTVGGDRSIGSGLLGQGNLFSDTSDGVAIMGSDNGIAGNLIGTDITGTGNLGNRAPGVFLEGDASRNIIGPDNIIAFNGIDGGGGVEIRSVTAQGNVITGNSIHDNSDAGILYNIGEGISTAIPVVPTILDFDIAAGVAQGVACPLCVVEIFSTDTQDGKIYEGAVTADAYGVFAFRTGRALSGPFLTATSSQPGLNTSEFSLSTPARSAIHIALDAIQDQAPIYQTGFDSWGFGDPVENARLENGKLIVTSENQEHVGVTLSNHTSDKFAVEFEVHLLEASPEGHCVLEMGNDGIDDSFRAMAYIFHSSGQMSLSHSEMGEDIAASSYDGTRPNTAMLLILGDQIAAFLNGEIAFAALDPDLSADYTHQTLTATYTIVCEFDNYKVWDLRGVDFNP